MTDAYLFRSIMESGTLEPVPCPVFNREPLLYFFYGRPAYRASAHIQSNGLDAYAPICIIMKPDAAYPHRIFPFDSGAFHHRLLADFTHHRMMKEDFELDKVQDMPGRLVNLFWSSDEAYYSNRAPSNFVPDSMDFEAKSYQELIRFKGKSGFDDRASAIEVQAADAISLAQNTLAVILPEEFAKPVIVKKIEDLSALALPYDHIARGLPVENVALIYSIVRALLRGSYGKVKYW
nr:hypothetical protein [Sphingomonas sp. CDS-1]